MILPGLLLALLSAQGSPPALGPSEIDALHPDRATPAKPAYGGRVVVHVDALPRNGLNGVVQNSGVATRILREVHETLLLRDWLTAEFRPDLAESWAVTEGGTVYTFLLRKDVRWHDGHPFDARDVLFSWNANRSAFLAAKENRFRFTKMRSAEVLDPFTVRFTWKEPYFDALATLGDMCILPAHLYDLSDPDNAEAARRRSRDPAWKPDEREQGEFVNKNTHNLEWVGLGPYRITKWEPELVEAVRFDGYFDPARVGYLDTIRWRYVASTDTAFQALLNGEIDFLPGMGAEDWFGETTQKPAFTEGFYKGWFYTSNYWYVGWNLQRPQLADARVRTALAMLFDFDEFQRGFYKGLAAQVTGPGSLFSAGYDRDLAPLPHDPKAAAALLEEAGWKDRDGDGVLDKDGVKLEIELLTQPNNKVGQAFGQRYQEGLGKAGIRLGIQQLEFATLNERRAQREFDAVALGWAPPIESDPEQIWHSRGAPKGSDGSNFSGLADVRVDALIEKGQRELDPEKRAVIWRELHRLVYELQPYLFCYNVPRKFAMSRRIRGFQSAVLDPGYVIRRWYYPEGSPGTRPSPVQDAAAPRKPR